METNVELPDYKGLESLFDKYAEHHKNTLTKENLYSIDEIKRRIQRINILSSNIMEINNKLLMRDEPLPISYVEGESIVMEVGNKKIKVTFEREDPNKPVQIEATDKASAYVAKSSGTADEEDVLLLKIELEEKLESFYQNSHKIIIMVKTLPGMKNLKCEEIRIVRNNLIVHPAGEHIYSFSCGKTTGPTVNPVKPHDTKNRFYDNGFVHNSKMFYQSLSDKLNLVIK